MTKIETPKINNIEQRLKEPFPAEDIEWRIASAGTKKNKPWAKCLCYVDARAVENRLDEVLGIQNWYNSLHQTQQGFLCSLSLRINGEWVTKVDGAEYTKYEPFKGGISDSLKRAAVLWGVGRYLYNIDSDNWAIFLDEPSKEKGSKAVKIEGNWYDWIPPKLPQWALPNNKPKDFEKNGSNGNNKTEPKPNGNDYREESHFGL